MQTTNMFGRRSRQQRELAGLDNLELPLQPRQSRLRRLWSGAGPSLRPSASHC